MCQQLTLSIPEIINLGEGGDYSKLHIHYHHTQLQLDVIKPVFLSEKDGEIVNIFGVYLPHHSNGFVNNHTSKMTSVPVCEYVGASRVFLHAMV